MKKLKYNITNEVFIDNTFKNMSVNLRPYKLMVICGLIDTEKIPLFLGFVLTKYTGTYYIYSYDK